MQIDVRNISDEGISLKFSKNFDFFPVLKSLAEKEGVSFLTPVNTEIEAGFTIDQQIRITGKSSVNIKLSCDRCLIEYNQPVSAEFNLLFSDSPPEIQEEEVQDEEGYEISGDSVDIEYYTGDIIQLKNVIQEQIILELPQRALCSYNCKGLCQKCGGNLNEKKCDCEKDVGHPAFAALKNLNIKK